MMLTEYYDSGGDDAHLDLGLEKMAVWGTIAGLGAKALPYASRLTAHAGKAWRAAAPAARAVGEVAEQAAVQPGIRGALGRGAAAVGQGFQKVWAPTGGRVWQAGKTFAAPAGQAIESGVAKGVGGVLGKPGEQVAANLMKGVPAQAAKDAVTFGALSAGLEGGIGAATAQEGERLKGFMEGAGHGALSGAAMGATMGAFGKGFRNLRSGSLEQAAKRQIARTPQMALFPEQQAAEMAKKQMERGFTGSIRDVFSRGGGPINRATSAQNVAGGLGQFGAEWIAPSLVLPAALGGGNPFATPEPEPTAEAQVPPKVAQALGLTEGSAAFKSSPEEPAVPPQLLTTLGGGAALGIPTSLAVSALSKKPWYPAGLKGELLGHAGRAVGSTTGVLGGHVAGKKLFPTKVPETDIEQKLEQIDFDKLMRYYKKREADQV